MKRWRFSLWIVSVLFIFPSLAHAESERALGEFALFVFGFGMILPAVIGLLFVTGAVSYISRGNKESSQERRMRPRSLILDFLGAQLCGFLGMILILVLWTLLWSLLYSCFRSLYYWIDPTGVPVILIVGILGWIGGGTAGLLFSHRRSKGKSG